MRRSIVRSAIDWAGIGGKLGSAGAKAEFAKLRSVAGEIDALSKTYSSPPPPIDFDSYASKIPADQLEEIKKYYAESVETTKLAAVGDKLEPAFTAEEKAELAELAARKEQLFADAEKSVAESKEAIEQLTAAIAMLESNMTDATTTLDDVYAKYPKMQAEIEEEINNHEWGKDIA